jgi:predicted lipid-binding transport protein (Tim44 family)
MSRALVMAGLLVLAPAAGLSSVSAMAQDSAAQPQQCADTAQKKAKRSMFGSVLGSLGGGLLGRAGVAGNMISLALPVGSYLTDELLKMLDCKEQRQAAKATEDAVRGGVGTEVEWKSESRPNVSGKSKVTASEQTADGGQCMTVTDVVIVDGEETTVPKKMCRAKGASAYARV